MRINRTLKRIMHLALEKYPLIVGANLLNSSAASLNSIHFPAPELSNHIKLQVFSRLESVNSLHEILLICRTSKCRNVMCVKV